MDNLFDLLESKIKSEQNKETIKEELSQKHTVQISKHIIDEDYLNHLEVVKLNLYNEDKIKLSGLERRDYIRLNSYVGSRMNTDLRSSNLMNYSNADLTTLNAFEFEETDENIEDIFNDSIDTPLLLIIDGSSLLSTNYFATLPREILFEKDEASKEKYYNKIMQTKNGIYTNGILGFMRTLLSILKNQKPTHLAVCLDSTRNTHRKLVYKDYKSSRKDTALPLQEQYQTLRTLLEYIGVPVFISDPTQPQEYIMEADDFAGTLSKKFQDSIPVALYSKDEDYLQLIDYNTVVWMNTSKTSEYALQCNVDINDLNLPSNVFEFNIDTLYKIKGLTPSQIIDFKALSGDPSDSIPGVKGCGPKSTIPLIQYYNNIESLYKTIDGLDDKQQKEIAKEWNINLGISRSPLKKLILDKDSAFLSKRLATIKTDIELNIELNNLKVNIDNNKLIEQLKLLELNSLI